ncbi:metallophosphoesterase family protein [Metabacillus halosaccharovorans]|uniref:Metallophosphatase family protein n=1 Tax=Metabacillus halosaccharovorans TaxID=930124 RepID=A0ABT3DFZ8_9BACI|nr:metallophosphatase family protein [Metabacillus halosaccharovorans]MCV9885982.1 metallophosphatase family protein [Metabacillus halosaccharovorans]
MKIAFISDIHGNAVALEAVLEDLKKKNIEKICILGDICYRGPEPKRSLELIQSLQAEVIKGNADEWVVRGVRQGEVPDGALEMMNKEREWIISNLESTDIGYLSQLPTELHLNEHGIEIFAFHATPTSLFEVIPQNAEDCLLHEKVLSKKDATIYLYAHIHKPYIRYINGRVIMNIGSVGLPFDGVTKASYGIITIDESGFSTSIERVGYDIEKVMKQYREAGYPNADMMIQVLKNGRI